MQSSLLFPHLLGWILDGLGAQSAGPDPGDGGPGQPGAVLVETMVCPALTGFLLDGLGAQGAGSGPDPGEPGAPLVDSLLYPALTGFILDGLGPQQAVTPPIAAVSIRKAVAAALAEEPTIAALVGDRIFPLFVPLVETEEFPALTYQLVSLTRSRHLRGPNGLARARVQITCISRNTDDADALADAVRVFDGFVGVLGGIAVVVETILDDERDRKVDAGDNSQCPYILTYFDFVFRFREPKKRLY